MKIRETRPGKSLLEILEGGRKAIAVGEVMNEEAATRLLLTVYCDINLPEMKTLTTDGAGS